MSLHFSFVVYHVHFILPIKKNSSAKLFEFKLKDIDSAFYPTGTFLYFISFSHFTILLECHRVFSFSSMLF